MHRDFLRDGQNQSTKRSGDTLRGCDVDNPTRKRGIALGASLTRQVVILPLTRAAFKEHLSVIESKPALL